MIDTVYRYAHESTIIGLRIRNGLLSVCYRSLCIYPDSLGHLIGRTWAADVNAGSLFVLIVNLDTCSWISVSSYA